MKKKTNIANNCIRVVTICIILGCIINTSLQVTSKQDKIAKSEKIIKLIYQYKDTNTLVANASVLEDLCEPEVFAVLDNRSKANVTRRFSKYTTTVPSIKDIYVQGNITYSIVAMNTESELRDRLITITYNKEGLVSDYKEYEFVNRFDRDYDFIGDFENSGNTDYIEDDSYDSTLTETKNGYTNVLGD